MGMSSGSGGPQNAAPMTDINTTPLVEIRHAGVVDHRMITAPSMQNKAPISLPEAPTEPDSAEERAVTLNIQERAAAWFNILGR